MGIRHEIARQPTNGEGFKFPIPIASSFQALGESGLFVIGEHSNHRHERVRRFRIVSVIFVGERNDEIAIARIRAFTQAVRDFGFDAIYDLLVQRHIVVRKIDIRLQPASVCNQGKGEKVTNVLRRISVDYQGEFRSVEAKASISGNAETSTLAFWRQ
jgi:hypothetical protein